MPTPAINRLVTHENLRASNQVYLLRIRACRSQRRAKQRSRGASQKRAATKTSTGTAQRRRRDLRGGVKVRRRRLVARLSPRLISGDGCFRRQAVGLKDRSRAGAPACFYANTKSRQWLKAKFKARRSRAGAAPE